MTDTRDVTITTQTGETLAVGYVPAPEALDGMSPAEIIDALADFMQRAATTAYKAGYDDCQGEIDTFANRNRTSLF